MDEKNVYVLEGSNEKRGGLFVKEKKKENSEDDGFKKPNTSSMFGLDKLAAQRRKEKEIDIDSKKRKYEENKQEKDKKYRKNLEETPTYTGGVSYEAQRRAQDRHDRYRDKGVYASSKDRHREGHDRRYERERSCSSHRSDRRSKTPKFSDEPHTPYYQMRSPISRSNWEDDDEPSDYRKSSWDYPTPKGESSGDRSERSHRSRRYDETPRPTPAHRFNSWAKDRKKTGATPKGGLLSGLASS